MPWCDLLTSMGLGGMQYKGVSYAHNIKITQSQLLMLYNPSPANAITWTYYNIDNISLVTPTEEEIDSTAVMRVSDNGVTQYILEINHDFSETCP